jgi:hypothetical protein
VDTQSPSIAEVTITNRAGGTELRFTTLPLFSNCRPQLRSLRSIAIHQFRFSLKPVVDIQAVAHSTLLIDLKSATSNVLDLLNVQIKQFIGLHLFCMFHHKSPFNMMIELSLCLLRALVTERGVFLLRYLVKRTV